MFHVILSLGFLLTDELEFLFIDNILCNNYSSVQTHFNNDIKFILLLTKLGNFLSVLFFALFHTHTPFLSVSMSVSVLSLSLSVSLLSLIQNSEPTRQRRI